MLRWLFPVLALFTAIPALAQPNHIVPELVAEAPATPGGEVEIAIVMHTEPGWHGYWLNPGDAGLAPAFDWSLPPGAALGRMRFPVPSRLSVAGLINYVFERDHALLIKLRVPATARDAVTVAAKGRWLACTDRVCVPEQGELALTVPIGGAAPAAAARFDEWHRALPRPLAAPAHVERDGDRLRLGIALPADVALADPYFYPADPAALDHGARQRFTRKGDTLIADLASGKGRGEHLDGVLALGDGRGLDISAIPGAVPHGGSPVGGPGLHALLYALLGALAGGVLLNLMPCVFPILAIKALHLARAGRSEIAARREALVYTAGTVMGTAALGGVLLAIRAGGSAAGWAFQLQDPRTVVLLLLLATAITLNLLRVFDLPVLGGETNPAGAFGTGALAAFVATPCAGPFLGAALGTALLLPAAGSIAVFAALGLGLAVPFVVIAFVPGLRNRLPRPGPWMGRLQRFLAIPMAATAAGCLWLLWRLVGRDDMIEALGLAGMFGFILFAIGSIQHRRKPALLVAALGIAFAFVIAAVAFVPERPAPGAASKGPAWSEQAVRAAQAAGHPVLVDFTADWCLTCKVNEAGAIDRDAVQAAFAKAGVEVLVADWTDGDPAITRFLDSRGRAGVPLYLWYAPGASEPEELPQILTPGLLVAKASASPPGRPSEPAPR